MRSLPWKVMIAGIGLLAATSAVQAAPLERPAKIDEAVERSLAYLARQQRGDGFFDHERKPGGKDIDSSSQRRAITGICVLAFLSTGQSQDAGRHGNVVRQAVDALTNAVPEDGYIGKLDANPMYTQAVVTLALSQAMGAEPVQEKRLKQFAALKRLVAVIVDAQNVKKDLAHAGGWRQQRDSSESELGISAWNLFALRGAQDAGVPVSPGVIKRATAYLGNCYVPAQRGFAVQPGGDATTAATAAAVLCLHLLPSDHRREAAEGLAALPGMPTDGKAAGGNPYQMMLHVSLAATLGGDETWRVAGRPMLDRLIKSQESDGGWANTWPADCQEPGRVYRTSMATLTLAVPYRVLPVYQR